MKRGPGRAAVAAVPSGGVGQVLPAVRGDLEEVFRREYGAVVRVAGRVLGSGREAEDVAQDVFIAFGRVAVPAERAQG